MARHAQANPSTSQSETALVAARPTRYVKLEGVYISSDTAMTVSLVNSATHDLVWRQYVGATGGSSQSGDLGTSRAGEGLDYSTSSSGNVFLKVAYSYSDD